MIFPVWIRITSFVSIQSTCAVDSHVFPASSSKVNVKLPFWMKRYCCPLSQVIVSLVLLIVAVTFPVVGQFAGE